jgi:putative ABC transport system permease protein
MPIPRSEKDTAGFRWRLLRQALLHKQGKALLIVLAVAMGSSVVSTLLNVLIDLRSRMNRELRDYGPNVILTASGSAYLGESVLAQLRSSNSRGSIIASSPQLHVPVQLGDQNVVITGVEIESMKRLFPRWKWRHDASGGAIVGIRLARRLHLQQGDAITIKTSTGNSASLKVSGMVEGGESEDDQIFMNLGDAQRMANVPGRFHSIALSVVGEIPTVQKHFGSLVASRPDVEFRLIRKIAAAETIILDKISRLMALIISLIFIILFFCIQTTVSAILLARQSEIALLRVLGARRKQIAWTFALELLALAVIGGVVGFLMGVVMSQVLGQVLFETYVVPKVHVFAVTLLASLLMMLFSSIFPVHRAVNRHAAYVLKEA